MVNVARAGVFEAVVLIVIVLLCAILFVVVAQGPDRHSYQSGWDVSTDGPVSKIIMMDDGSLYLFGGANGNTLHAIGPNGVAEWAFEVPDRWIVSQQVFAVDDGTVYLYLYPFDDRAAEMYGGAAGYRAAIDEGHIIDGSMSIMAISDHGKMLWLKDVPNGIGNYGTSNFAAVNGHLYYYNNDSVMVLDRSGRAVFNVTDIFGAPTVDEFGNIYVVKLYSSEDGGFGPDSIIETYRPDGTLYWRNDLGRRIYGIINYGETPAFNSILLYQDNSLYAWVDNGAVRLSTNGSIIWSKTFPYNAAVPLEAMPIDLQGNMYYQFYAYPRYIDIVTPDGTEILRDFSMHNATFGGREDGVIYYVDYYFDNKTVDDAGKEDLMHANITAYNVLEDRYLWNYSFVPQASEFVIGSDNAEVLQSKYGSYHGDQDSYVHSIMNHRSYDADSDEQVLWLYSKWLYCNWGIHLARGTDVLYVDYYSFNWQYPAVSNQSTCLYSNRLYAIAYNGTLLWDKPLSSLVTSMAANNSTLYYSTKNGGFYVENAAKIGGGLALLAIAYLLARFLVIGSIARARGRLDKNENRNHVMRYIADNPGLTAREIARGLGVNLGTIRYHLLILGMNHKIVTFRADQKHIRYFRNSNSYNKDEQLVLSLVRRDGMRRVLKLLIDRGQVSNSDMSKALDMRESAVSRYTKELMASGIIVRDRTSEGNLVYSIKEDCAGHVQLAMKRINS